MRLAFTRTGSVPVSFQPASSDASADQTLIARIAHGDQLAMRILFARHHTRVYRFIMRFVKNETTAEDLLSEVFLDVWRWASRFEGRAAVSTWLLAIARFKALSVMRLRTDEELDMDVAASIADPSDDPPGELERKHDFNLLHQALIQLSQSHAEVIDLVYYHGKSVREVAEIIGVSEATVKTRMLYARKKLSKLIQCCTSDAIH